MYIGDGNIGDIIRVLRNERGMTREQLAEKSEISLSHLNKIETGIKKPSIVTYQKIMNILRAEISIREEGETELERCIAKAKAILLFLNLYLTNIPWQNGNYTFHSLFGVNPQNTDSPTKFKLSAAHSRIFNKYFASFSD